MTPLRLLRPGSVVERIGHAHVPDELYWVARDPVVLLGMAYPARVAWDELHARGVGHVVCLTHDDPPYDPSPLTCTAVALQDLFGGRAPDDPDAERARVLLGARAVVDHLRAGTGVAVHCRAGRGRTGTVLGVALVLLGRDPEAVIAHLDALQAARGRSLAGWPESPWQADVVRDAAHLPDRTPAAAANGPQSSTIMSTSGVIHGNGPGAPK